MKIRRNWNRISELTNKRFNGLSKEEQIELTYRIEVQNYFSNKGKLPKNYIPVVSKFVDNIEKKIKQGDGKK